MAEKEAYASESSIPASPPEKRSEDANSSKLESGELDAEKEAPALGGERTIRGISWFLAVIAILSSTFLFALDTTVVSLTQLQRYSLRTYLSS